MKGKRYTHTYKETRIDIQTHNPISTKRTHTHTHTHMRARAHTHDTNTTHVYMRACSTATQTHNTYNNVHTQ